MKKKSQSGCCSGVLDNLSPELFRALSDPNRVAILAHLAKTAREQTVTDVTTCCAVDYSVVSRHLKVLLGAGAVAARKEGKMVYYALQTPALIAFLRGLADALEACCPGGTCKVQREGKES